MFYRDEQQHSVVKILKISLTTYVMDWTSKHIKHFKNITHLYPEKTTYKGSVKLLLASSIYYFMMVTNKLFHFHLEFSIMCSYGTPKLSDGKE